MSSRRHRMDRQVSIYCSKVNVSEVAGLLEGDLENLPPISSRTVRVFLSSTFSDMTHERNALMEHVYSKIKKFCRNKYGLEFHVMDLRWGIRDESHNDHTIIDACLEEIETCNKLSIGPNFVALLGDKYGYRPFPPNIKAEEFQHLRKALVDDRKDVSILDCWFKMDENTIPPMYRLVPINTILPDFNPQVVTKKQRESMDEWNKTFSKIQKLLRKAAILCSNKRLIDERIRDKYFVSVTEYEIYRGLFNVSDPSKDCLGLYRKINGLDNHLENRRAAKFTDLIPQTTKLDEDARSLLKMLKHHRVPAKLPAGNIHKLSVDWTDPSKDPTDNPEYLKRFCTAFEEQMTELIDKNVAKMEVMDSYVIEVVQHLKMCRDRCEMFRGREDIVSRAKSYMTDEDRSVRCSGGQLYREPLVVYGDSGTGKTSILAKVASLVSEWMTNATRKPVLLLRFLGTTARSSSIRLTLGVICWHLSAIYERDISDIPMDYLGLVSCFHDRLQLATAEKPLVMILDSLDQLSKSHNAHDLTWLPKQLPPHVYLIVSTLRYEHDILETLKANLGGGGGVFLGGGGLGGGGGKLKSNFVEVEALGAKLGLELVQEWLTMSERRLTPTQTQLVHQALRQCSLPLYTRLIFQEVCRWKSWQGRTGPEQLPVLENTVKGVVNQLLHRMEHQHGRKFVAHALSYITASRDGLGDMEMEDVLSLDDHVLNDVFIHWLPPIRRIPPLLWPRLLNDLRSYIIQRESYGMIVYYWYHRQFKQVAKERYMSDVGHKVYIHTILAIYFMGVWGGGQQKPFKYTEDQKKLLGLSQLEGRADRKVPLQPLHIGSSEDRHGHKRLPYHLRKLAELPHQLIQSKRKTDLYKEVLFNYDWLHTKLTAMSIHDLLADFKNALSEEQQNMEVQILANSLRIGGSNISEHANTLAFELSGRLLPYYDENHRNIRSLLQSCDTTALAHCALLPLFQCFESPRGMLTYILEDHSQVVYDLLFCRTTRQLVSVSKDGTIGFWDYRTGDRTKMIDITDLAPGRNTRLFQSGGDGRYLICDSDHLNSPVYIYDMKTGLLKYKVGARTNTQRRGFIVGNLLCRQKNLINVAIGQLVCTIDDFVESKEYLTCGITPNEKYILIGQKDKIGMFHIATRKKIMEFETGGSVPCTFYITEDSTKCYTGYADDCLFKILCIDPTSKDFGRELLKFNYKESFPTYKFPDGHGSHYNDLDEIAVCPGKETSVLLNIKRCILVLLKIKPNYKVYVPQLLNQKAISKPSSPLTAVTFSGDGRYVLVSEGHFLHVWAIEGQFLASLTLHSVDSFPLAVARQSSVIATASQIHTAVKVWDLANIKSCSGKQIELYENPLDHVVGCPAHRLVFIKKYHGTVSGYKYFDYFGVDVWNLSTGTCAPLLPYGNYGQMEQMDASANGAYLAMLIKVRSEHSVVVLRAASHHGGIHSGIHGGIHAGGGGKLVAVCPHANCTSFVVCPRWVFLVTVSSVGDIPQLKLWSIDQRNKHTEVEALYHCTSPAFSLDGAYLFYIENGATVVQYDLGHNSAVQCLHVKASKITVLPNRPDLLMVTRWSEEGGKQTDIRIWSIRTKKCVSTLQHVSPSGIMDISKDGRYAIDSYLQVYDVIKGIKINDLGNGFLQEVTLVHLTYDGQYAVWAEERYVRVARVQPPPQEGNNNNKNSGMGGSREDLTSTRRVRKKLPYSRTGSANSMTNDQCIGYICTHEKTASLTTLDNGYLIVIGREDGHVITARLVDGVGQLPPKFKPLTLRERTDTLLDGIPYPDGLIATFDPYYREKTRRLADEALPRLGEEVHKELERRAKVPHAIIKTPSASNLYSSTTDSSSPVSNTAKNRRGSSPILSQFWTGPRRKEASPTSSGNNSPLPSRRPPLARYFSPDSPKTLPRRAKQILKHKSPSLTDLFGGGTSNKPPRAPMKSGGVAASTSGGPFTIHSAVQNTGALALAVTDVSPSASHTEQIRTPSGLIYKVKKTFHLTGKHADKGGCRRLSQGMLTQQNGTATGSETDLTQDGGGRTESEGRRKRCSSASSTFYM